MSSSPVPQLVAGAQGHVKIDHDDASDAGDSALGSATASNASTSLLSSVRQYEYENGRRYHAYREGAYLMPNDDAEQDRLDLDHHIFRLMLGGALFRAPIGPSPGRVLDFGTGTGIWAIDFADEFPTSTVVGTDLSPIQPSWTPVNCKFYIDDAESDWTFRPEEHFDFIHGRGMGGSIADWDRLFQNIKASLRPGGWLETQEYEAWVSSDDDPTLSKCPNVKKWNELCDEGSLKFGKRFNVAGELKQRMIKAGFHNVQEDIYKIPIGTWAKDKRLKEVGLYQREHMIMSVEAFTMALFTRILGWSAEETHVLMAGVRNEFADRNNHLVTIFHYLYGQKPEE